MVYNGYVTIKTKRIKMEDFIILVVIIAIICGISIQAAAINAFWIYVALIAIPIVVSGLIALFAPTNSERIAEPKRTQPAAKSWKMPTWMKTLLKWSALLVFTYAIAELFLVTTGAYEKISSSFSNAGLPFWALFIVPAIPFLSIFAIFFVKRIVNKKHANRQGKRA
jgi:hypothetical protein